MPLGVPGARCDTSRHPAGPPTRRWPATPHSLTGDGSTVLAIFALQVDGRGDIVYRFPELQETSKVSWGHGFLTACMLGCMAYACLLAWLTTRAAAVAVVCRPGSSSRSSWRPLRSGRSSQQRALGS